VWTPREWCLEVEEIGGAVVMRSVVCVLAVAGLARENVAKLNRRALVLDTIGL